MTSRQPGGCVGSWNHPPGGRGGHARAGSGPVGLLNLTRASKGEARIIAADARMGRKWWRKLLPREDRRSTLLVYVARRWLVASPPPSHAARASRGRAGSPTAGAGSRRWAVRPPSASVCRKCAWLPQRLLFWWNLFGAMAQLKSNFAVGLFLWACLPPEAHACPQDRHRCSRLATLVRGCAVCGSQHPACLGEHAQAVRASLRRMDAACPSLAALAVIGLGRENKAGHGGKAH